MTNIEKDGIWSHIMSELPNDVYTRGQDLDPRTKAD